MQLGFIGLGRMGANMVRRLAKDGHEIVAHNRTIEKAHERPVIHVHLSANLATDLETLERAIAAALA